MWAELASEPVVVLTGDQDWAPTWATQRQLEIARRHEVPLHLFITHDDPLVREPPDGLTLGLHPNFLPGSTHGDDPAAIVEHCLRLVPGATTARCHHFTESTAWLAELARRGVRAHSADGTLLQAGLVPGLHLSGMLRVPVFLEDDVLLHWAGRVPTVDELRPFLLTPGLKLLSFHPAHVGINSRDEADYAAARSALYGDGEPPSHGGRGCADLLDELLVETRAQGLRVIGFPELVDRAEALVHAAHPDGILGWSPGAAW